MLPSLVLSIFKIRGIQIMLSMTLLFPGHHGRSQIWEKVKTSKFIFLLCKKKCMVIMSTKVLAPDSGVRFLGRRQYDQTVNLSYKFFFSTRINIWEKLNAWLRCPWSHLPQLWIQWPWVRVQVQWRCQYGHIMKMYKISCYFSIRLKLLVIN